MNAKDAEAEWFYEDLQGLLELTSPPPHTHKDVLFIIGDWNAKVGSQIVNIFHLLRGRGLFTAAKQLRKHT